MVGIALHLFECSFDIQEKITKSRTPINNLIRKSLSYLKNFRRVEFDFVPTEFLSPQLLENLPKMIQKVIEEENLDRDADKDSGREEGRDADPRKKENPRTRSRSRGRKERALKKSGDEDLGEKESEREKRKSEFEKEKQEETSKLLSVLRLDTYGIIIKSVCGSIRSPVASAISVKIVKLLNVITNGLVENVWILRQLVHKSAKLKDFYEEYTSTSPSTSLKVRSSLLFPFLACVTKSDMSTRCGFFPF